MKMENDAWYFAYGSNLSTQRMQERIGRVPEARRARLDGYRLVFNKRGTDGTGKANVVADRHGTVWGIVYRCTAAEIRQLEHDQGVSSDHYRRRTVRVRDDHGAKI